MLLRRSKQQRRLDVFRAQLYRHFSSFSWKRQTQTVPFLTFRDWNYFFFILAHTVYKMWIIQETNTLELWNKLHFEEKKPRVYSLISIQPWRPGLAGTRAKSYDRYGSGTLHPGQVLGGSLPLLSSAFRRSHFSRQVPPSATTREILPAKVGTVGEKDVR